MAAPTFVKATAGATDTGGAWSYTVDAPAAAGNLFIVQVFQDGVSGEPSITSATNCTNLAGTANLFTLLLNSAQLGPVGSPTVGYQTLYAARSTGTSAIVITGANSGTDDIYYRAYEFTNVATGTTVAAMLEPASVDDVIDAATQVGNGTSTTVSDVGVTTTAAGRLALNFVALADDAMGLAAFAGETGGDWTLATAIYETATGTDATIALMQAAMPSAGTINGGSDTITSIGWGVIGFALLPSAAGTPHTAEPDDSLSLADATAHARGLGRSESLAVADSFARTTVTARSVIDSLVLADARALAAGKGLTEAVALTDLASRELAYARSLTDPLALADSASPQLVSGGAEVVPRAILLRL